MSDSIRDRRVQYETAGLDVGELAADPIAQWQLWHDAALDAGVVEPNAMTLATIGLDGIPDSRIVLVRGLDARGLVFYTNYDGAKSQQLDASPVASATFSWLDLHRQVRVRGSVERISAEESDAYFASRPRASQLGAWSSPQSDEIARSFRARRLPCSNGRTLRRHRDCSAARQLGWVALDSDRVGVLARPPEPPPRSAPLPPHE